MQRGLIGACGEFYVAAELSRRGWLATVTIKNSPGTDVLAQDFSSSRVIALQTKTASPGSHFRLGSKDERVATTDNEWYALVGLREPDQRPDFYLLPRNHVSALLFVSHRGWLYEPGRGGKPRNDSAMRIIDARNIPDYHERWDLLEQPTTAVPYSLPDWVRTEAAKFGLPPGHPDGAQLGMGKPGHKRRAERK